MKGERDKEQREQRASEPDEEWESDTQWEPDAQWELDEEREEEEELGLEENIHLNSKKIFIFVGLLALAILICIPLWILTSRNLSGGVSGEHSSEAVTSAEESLVQETEGETQEPAPETQPETTPEETAEASEEGGTMESQASAQEPSGTQESVPEASGTQESSQPQESQSAQGTQDSESLEGGSAMSFTQVSESVTAKDVTNLRTEPDTGDDGNIAGQLRNGETAERTGVNESTGWSRLVYNGQTVYAVTSFLTTDLDYKTPVAPSDPNRITTQDGRVIIFTDCDDYITPKEYVNLRIEPSTSQGDSTVSCQVSNGEVVHRTGYSQDSGWSRVEYNGQVLYVVSSYVTAAQAPSQSEASE